MKRVVVLFLALALLLAGCGGRLDRPASSAPEARPTEGGQESAPARTEPVGQPGDPARLEGEGFESGEAVMIAALSAIRSCDLEALVSCYAVESFLERYRFDDYYAWTDYRWTPTVATGEYLPEGDGFGDAVNRDNRVAEVLCDAAQPFIAAANGCFAAQMEVTGSNFSAVDSYTMLYTGKIAEREGRISLEDYLARLTGGEAQRVFSTLRVTGGAVRVTEAALEQYSEESRQKRRNWHALEAKAYGADEVAEFGVPVNVDGCDCCFTVTALRYGESWYLLSLGGIYSEPSSRIGGFALNCQGLENAGNSQAPVLTEPGRKADLSSLNRMGAGFRSAEAAAEAYVEALRNLDYDAAAACYAADRIADENLQMSRKGDSWRCETAPIGGGSFLAPAARETLSHAWMWRMWWNLLVVTDAFGGSQESIESYSPADIYIHTSKTEEYPNARAQLRDLLTYAPAREALQGIRITGEERFQNKLMFDRGQSLGAENYVGIAMKLEIGGKAFQLCIEAACFGGKWYLVNPMYYNAYLPDPELPLLLD